MDITSYLLGKKSSGGGGGGSTEKTKPYTISFASTSSVVSPDSIDVSLLVTFNKMFYQHTGIEELDLSSWSNNSVTDMNQACYGCSNLKKFIFTNKLDTSNVTTFKQMFYGCKLLEDVSKFNFSSVGYNGVQNMFYQCWSLTDTSLNNILLSCITMNPSYTAAKTLAVMGFARVNYPEARIQALPAYQDFIDAGWTIGY